MVRFVYVHPSSVRYYNWLLGTDASPLCIVEPPKDVKIWLESNISKTFKKRSSIQISSLNVLLPRSKTFSSKV